MESLPRTNCSCELPRNLSMEGVFLLVLTCRGLGGTRTQPGGTEALEPEMRLGCGFNVGTDKVEAIAGSGLAPVTLSAVTGVCR